MAETTTASASSTRPAAADDEPTYTVDELVEYAELRLGASRHAVRGALAETRKKHLTVAEASEAIDKFLKRKVS